MFECAARTRGNVGPEPKPELPHESVLTCRSKREAVATVCGFGGLLGSGPCTKWVCVCTCVCVRACIRSVKDCQISPH